MHTPAFDAIIRRAVPGISRRRSLLNLGGAALGATLAWTGAVEAKKRSTCKDKEQKRYKADIAACKQTILLGGCASQGPGACEAFQACCDSCSADGFVICIRGLQP